MGLKKAIGESLKAAMAMRFLQSVMPDGFKMKADGNKIKVADQDGFGNKWLEARSFSEIWTQYAPMADKDKLANVQSFGDFAGEKNTVESNISNWDTMSVLDAVDAFPSLKPKVGKYDVWEDSTDKPLSNTAIDVAERPEIKGGELPSLLPDVEEEESQQGFTQGFGKVMKNRSILNNPMGTGSSRQTQKKWY